MAITEVQVKKNNATAAGALALTLDAPSTIHNLLVAVLSGYTTDDATALGPITAPAGWTEAIKKIFIGAGADNNFGIAIYYYQDAPVTGGAISFTWANSERTVLCVGEYSDMNLSDVLDQTASHQVVLGDAETGDTAATGQGAELLIGGMAALANITIGSFTNSFTSAQTDIASSGSFHNRLYHLKRIVSATGVYGCTGTPSATGAQSLGVIATFKGNIATGTMTMGTNRANLTCRGMKLSSAWTTDDGAILRPLASGLYRG